MSVDGLPRVLVVDTQPIHPPVGGGRVRLLGLYHALGLPTTYLGSYDWYDAPYRCHQLSPTLVEVNVPLSREHLNLGARWAELSGLPTVMDTAFPLLCRLSPDLAGAAAAAVRQSEIVVVSHPWAFPLVRDAVLPGQLLVYDAHNVEGLLRTRLLDDGGFGTELARHVLAVEYELAHRADLIVACSDDDGVILQRLYGVSPEKTRTAPNGVFASQIVPPTREQKQAAKQEFRHAGRSAIFVGSAYEPNIEAVEFICDRLAPALAEITFLVCGGVTEAAAFAPRRNGLPGNVCFVGPVSEEQKLHALWAADFAVNPMFTGSGTNIKMFDYLAAGLPTVTTPIGARGIDAQEAFITADANGLATAMGALARDPDRAHSLSLRARRLVEERFAWEVISPNLGRLLRSLVPTLRGGTHALPFRGAGGVSPRDAERSGVRAPAPRRHEERAEARERLAVPHAPVVGVVGGRAAGVESVLEATAVLRQLFPDILLYCPLLAERTRPEDDFFAAWVGRVQRLDLQRNTWLDAHPRDTTEMIRDLQACDVLVVLAEEMEELTLAHGVAATAARRPIVAIPPWNCPELEEAVYRVESGSPHVVALALANVLSSGFLRQSLTRRVEGLLAARRWAA